MVRGDLFPAHHGAAVKIDRTAWGLSRLAGPVFLVTDNRTRYYRYVDGKQEAVRFPFWLRCLGPWRRIIARRLRRARIPVQEISLYTALRDWSFPVRAAYVTARYGVRLYQAEFPAYAQICLWIKSVFGGCAVLVEHNVEFERIRDQVTDLSHAGYRWLRQTEIGLCNRVDRVVTVSRRDRALLIRHGVDADHVHVIPHGVDVAAFDTSHTPDDLCKRLGIAPGRPTLVYHGTFRYPPNLEAIRIFASEILPRLNARGLDPLMLAIGADPPDRDLHPQVVFSGGVDSVAPYIKAAHVAVVPLLKGGGTRMKVLDYFAAGVPVVSTAKGVEGLEVRDGIQLLVHDDWDAFAAGVARLLREKALARTLGTAGRRFAEQHDWLTIAGHYVDLYTRCP